MASYNKSIVAGNMTRDPEIRVTPSGKSIAQFGIAVTRKFKDTEETLFLDCEAWDKTAELIGKYCAKGSSVLVDGRLKMDQWEDKQTGAKRSKIKLVVESVQFLGKPKDSTTANDGERTERRSIGADGTAGRPTNAAPGNVDEDCPF